MREVYGDVCVKSETSCSGKSASVLVRSGDVTPSRPGRQSADPCRGPATPEETNPITRHLHFSWCLPTLCTLVSPKVIMSLVPLRLRRLMQPRLSAPLRSARESTGAVSECPLRARRCRESDGGRRAVSRTEEKSHSLVFFVLFFCACSSKHLNGFQIYFCPCVCFCPQQSSCTQWSWQEGWERSCCCSSSSSPSTSATKSS